MSRRRYEARQRSSLSVSTDTRVTEELHTPDTSIDESNAPDWDEDAIAEARNQANQVAAYDLDAARHLLRQASAAERRLFAQSTSSSVLPTRAERAYDPMRLYARMGMVYPWMSKRVIDEMHFPTFFAYVREANIKNDEDKAEYERIKRETRNGTSQVQTPTTPEEAAQLAHDLFPQAQIYDGEVMPYVG